MQIKYTWRYYRAQNAKTITSLKVALSTINKGIYVKNATTFLLLIKWEKK
ncbi:hypothetical protein HNP99_002415 [Flavobacterium sp. 28A]|nr:hypothetical protein [Flavobacterium sp. 28A]